MCRETEVEREEKNLKNIIKAEKDKRLHLEERITTRLEKTGVVVLERGAVLTTPQQLHADLEVTRQQLRNALETVEETSKELDIRKCRETEIEGLEKNLKNIIKAEKNKRLHLEERITTRLEKTGVVVLEGGAVLATPQQISLHADLEVTSQQLRKALETVEEKSKELDIKKCRETEIEEELSKKDKELQRSNTQLAEHRHQARMRRQKDTRACARKLDHEHTRCCL